MSGPDPVSPRPIIGPAAIALTVDDAALILRAARIIRSEAEAIKLTIKLAAEPWTGTEGRAAKRTYDRYLREERDLRELAKLVRP